jgi:hypothetical protein
MGLPYPTASGLQTLIHEGVTSRNRSANVTAPQNWSNCYRTVFKGSMTGWRGGTCDARFHRGISLAEVALWFVAAWMMAATQPIVSLTNANHILSTIVPLLDSASVAHI